MWLPVTKSSAGDLARLAALRPQRVDAFERGSERDHGAGRQRHADIPADGRRVVDLERHQQRVAAQFQQRRRGPVGGRLELLELGDRAGRGDFKSVGGQLERRPAQRLEIDQRVGGDLRRREQPGAAGKIGITRLPPGNFVGGGRALDLGNGVQIHDRRPMRRCATMPLIHRRARIVASICCRNLVAIDAASAEL